MLPEKHLLTFATHLNYFSLLKSKQDVSYPVTAPEIENPFALNLCATLWINDPQRLKQRPACRQFPDVPSIKIL